MTEQFRVYRTVGNDVVLVGHQDAAGNFTPLPRERNPVQAAWRESRSRPCLSCGAYQYANGTLPCGH